MDGTGDRLKAFHQPIVDARELFYFPLLYACLRHSMRMLNHVSLMSLPSLIISICSFPRGSLFIMDFIILWIHIERMILSLAACRPHAFPTLNLDLDEENRTEDKLEIQRYHILGEGMRSSRISHLSLVHPKFNGRRDVSLMPPLN